jgi:hypothetical protein
MAVSGSGGERLIDERLRVVVVSEKARIFFLLLLTVAHRVSEKARRWLKGR